MNENPTLFDTLYDSEGNKVVGPSVVDDLTVPLLPYNGTSGWSGSDTSEARASQADADGTTSRRQQEALRLVRTAGEHGVTWQELAQRMGLHHGSASGVLSGLHKAGVITRLTEQRNRCQVYVSPQHVAGRTQATYKPNVSARLLVELLTELASDLDAGQVTKARTRIGAHLRGLQGN
jgi:DNA-binding MarR family transcriptional regulator